MQPENNTIQPPMEVTNPMDSQHILQRDQGNALLDSIDKNTENNLIQNDESIKLLNSINQNLEHSLVQNDQILKAKPEVQKVELILPDLGNGGEADTTGLSQNLFQMLKGKKGDKGDKGDTGEKGDTGNDGYTPVKGVDYVDGEKGIDGKEGIQGIQGIQGNQGIQGIQGEKGDTPNVDLSFIFKKVEKMIPQKMLDKEILDLIRGKIKYEELIDVPTFARKNSSKTGSIVELDDVDLTGLTRNAQGKYVLGSGGGGGAVSSVNGYVGAVVLIKSDIGLGNVDNTSDVNKPVSTATQTALNLKENSIAAGTTSQYWRGDKTWQTLDKNAVGLGNVDNTSDVNKPVSTAQATADTAATNAAKAYADTLVVGLLDDRGNFNASGNVFPSSGGSGSAGAVLKGDLWTISVAGTLGGVAVTAGDVVRALVDTPGNTGSNWAVSENNFGYVAENQANKDTSTSLGTSNTLYPTQNAVKVYADTKEASITGTTSADFWSGAKTFINFATTVRGTVLTGLSLATSQVIAATDTVLLSLGYLQAQITTLTTTVSNKVASVTAGTNVTITGTATNPIVNATADMVLGTAQTNTALKTFLDATIGHRNVANTITSFFTNAATVARTWTFPDKDGTVAMTSDITGTNSGTNTGDVTLTGTPNYITIAGQVITRALIDLTAHVTGLLPFANIASVATSTVMYRKTAGTGSMEAQTLATLKTDLNLTGTNSGDQTITLTGDVTGTGTGSFAATIAANAVTNAKLAQIATQIIKGRTTAATGNVEDLTVTQVTAMLNVFTSALQGLVPASGGGTTTFLRADGIFAAPPGGGGSGITRSISQIATNTSAGSTALVDYVYEATAAADLLLPTAVGNLNMYILKNTSSLVSTVRFITTSSQTIDGSTTAIVRPNQSLAVVSNNSNWIVI